MGIARRVLVNSNQARDSAALGEDLAHAMARRLGRGQRYVDVLGGHDGLVVDVEAVREHQHGARLDVRRDLFGVDIGLRLVRRQDHHHIGPLGGVGHGVDLEPGLLRLGSGFGAGSEAYLYLNSRVLEVKGMGMPL